MRFGARPSAFQVTFNKALNVHIQHELKQFNRKSTNNLIFKINEI